MAKFEITMPNGNVYESEEFSAPELAKLAEKRDEKADQPTDHDRQYDDLYSTQNGDIGDHDMEDF